VHGRTKRGIVPDGKLRPPSDDQGTFLFERARRCDEVLGQATQRGSMGLLASARGATRVGAVPAVPPGALGRPGAVPANGRNTQPSPRGRGYKAVLTGSVPCKGGLQVCTKGVRLR
jgi:hypothetical protein